MIEKRRQDGNPYPPRTLYMLAVGILRHLRENGVHFNFLDENNSNFYDFRKALSARMAELTNQGVGTTTKQAEPVSRGLSQRHIVSKDIKHHLQNPALYDLYEGYLASIPPAAGDAFYRRPLANRGENGELRFSSQPIGVNKLSYIIKNMSTEAGISGFFTNHSGKRTCATALYQACSPEQEIMSRTGHRSVESVRKYKRPSSEMLKDV
ncbi:hypothetical protein FSP39_012266 [Pinctada imbricata]|uniref:Tyr recombinase domain-containing protein n=1 Tax=Pinctada imbricata TaxID=66713 RepID=A0AA88Y4H5_PINIB|nr:hypothetical protein FSP39_012266 [Pinctada imbricata]